MLNDQGHHAERLMDCSESQKLLSIHYKLGECSQHKLIFFAAQHDSISLEDDRTTDAAESRMSYLIEVPRVDVSSLVEDLKMELGMIFEL